jgi:hypothetical protein
MATNNRTSYGFRWSTQNGGGPCPQSIPFFVADAYQATVGGSNVDLGVGDPVEMVSDGSVSLAAGSEGTPDPILGIIVGVQRYYDGTVIRSGTVVPGASTGGGILERQTRVLVVPANWGLWEVDVDDNTTATTEAAYQAFINENADHVLVRTKVNGKFRAKPELDISGHATTAGLAWRIVGISQTFDNSDFGGKQVKLVVACNKAQWAGWPATTIAGV